MAKASTGKSTELAAFAANLPALDAKKAAAALNRGADNSSSDGGDHLFMSFSGKQDRYSLGRDKDEPEADAVYAIAPGGTLEGWNLWKGGSVPKKHLWSIFEQEKAISEDELEDAGELGKNDRGWSKVLGLTMLDIDDEKRRKIVFTVDSISARNVFSALIHEMADKVGAEDPANIPLVQWGSESFTAQGNTNYKPLVDILGWTTDAEMTAFLDDPEGTLDDLFDGKYASTPDAEPEPEPQPEPAAKKPARGRRKAA